MSPRKSKGWTVYPEPSGDNWRCRWEGKYGTGQQVFSGYTAKDDALELVLAKRQDFARLDAGLPVKLRPSSAVTVADFAAKYLKQSKKEKSARTYRNFDKPAVEPFVDLHGGLAVAALTDEHVRAAKEVIEARYNGTTASMYFRALRTFLNAAVKSGHLTKSPALHVPRPAEGPGGRAMKDEELTALLSVAETILYRTGNFSLQTMLRIDEVCRFDWSWVWTLPGDKWLGKIPAEVRKTRGKIKEDCIFAINAQARNVMGKRQLSGRVFPWTPTTIQHQFVRARVAAKLPDDLSFHSFRHTGASKYLANGGHMEDLLKSRQWNDARSLLRYVHIDPAVLWARYAQMGRKTPSVPLNAKSRKPRSSRSAA